MLVHAGNHSSWEVEAGGPRVEGCPLLYQFEGSLGYMRSCLTSPRKDFLMLPLYLLLPGSVDHCHAPLMFINCQKNPIEKRIPQAWGLWGEGGEL